MIFPIIICKSGKILGKRHIVTKEYMKKLRIRLWNINAVFHFEIIFPLIHFKVCSDFCLQSFYYRFDQLGMTFHEKKIHLHISYLIKVIFLHTYFSYQTKILITSFSFCNNILSADCRELR